MIFTSRQAVAPVNGYELLDTFADNNWEAIAWACQTGNVPETWTVGSRKTMTIGSYDYNIDIIGKAHDEYSDGSGKAPLTFQMQHIYIEQLAMHSTATNSVGWEGCDMRKTHLPAILSKMPAAVQGAIREVNKKTSVGNKSLTLETTADKLFLLSESEVLGTTSYSASGEGSRYAYFAGGSWWKSDVEWGEDAYWRSRSPSTKDTEGFCTFNTSQSVYSSQAAATSGVAAAFCF